MEKIDKLLRSAIALTWLLATAAIWWPGDADAARLKEVATVQGVRSNSLVGYGLVVGLDGTGDQTTSAPFTTQSLNAMSASVAADAQNAVSEKTGVNLDEEAARLIQFQQSYQAAAKMLQVAQSVFDTLLKVGGA